MNKPCKGSVDYTVALKKAPESRRERVTFLFEELPYVWRDAYIEMTMRRTDIVRWRFGSFEYLFDDRMSPTALGHVPQTETVDARLIAAIGISSPCQTVRDDYRLRGWVGRTEKMFGRQWDKGHFVAHSIGGAVAGLEANVFVQRRELNRGWSREGKQFREMENYCFFHPGTLCFSRPLYEDESARPASIEFGVLKDSGQLWIESFDNRGDLLTIDGC